MKRNPFRTQRRGVSAIIVVQLFVVMLFFAFFAINMANLQRHHTASQISSDLAARWGVDALSRSDNTERIERQVRELAHRNWSTSGSISGDLIRSNRKNIDVDIAFGSAKPSGQDIVFRENQKPFNAVRVKSHSFIGTTGFYGASELQVNRSATAVALERDICLVIDRSGSMTFDLDTGDWMMDRSTHDYNPMSTSRNQNIRNTRYTWWWYWAHPENSRWCTMIPAVYGLADELNSTRQNELFSIVSYSAAFNYNIYDHNLRVRNYRGGNSSVEVDPSFNYEDAVRQFERKYKWDQPVAGGTNISSGIDEAIGVLMGPDARSNSFKTMIVMTDGQSNSGRNPVLAARDAADEGIEVYTVTFSNQADQGAMRDVADAGNGRPFPRTRRRCASGYLPGDRQHSTSSVHRITLV